MDERPANSKSKDKRLEEKEKLEAELERSMAVARMKQAHKMIEDTEKLRKRSAMLSICKRIENLKSNAIVLSGILLKAEGETPGSSRNSIWWCCRISCQNVRINTL